MIASPFTSLRLRKNLELLQSRPWSDEPLPDEVAAVPTMLTLRERQMLHWLARKYVRGKGRIVDGGCFLGGSTAALASGLAAREDRKWKNTIATFDLFRVEPYTLADFSESFTDPTVGESFLSDFNRQIASWSKHVEIFEGDITKHGWTGERIELLFIDVAKTWGINDLLLHQFFPRLIPGQSVIIQQDYMWAFAPWIHITMELLAPYVTILDSMMCSVAYLLKSSIPRKFFKLNLRTGIPDQMKLELMDRAVNRWTGTHRGMVELSRISLLSEIHSVSAARKELQEIEARYASDGAVENCIEYVARDLANAA